MHELRVRFYEENIFIDALKAWCHVVVNAFWVPENLNFQ